jgi:hypothetical protein
MIGRTRTTARELSLLAHPTRPPVVMACHGAMLVAPALLYFLTASRTPGWADATLIVSQVTGLDLGTWVDTHNLFDLMGNLWLRLFPTRDVHYPLVLLGGLFGTLTVYFMFRVVLEMTGELVSAGFAGLALMVSHSLWWHSTMLEVYTLDSAAMAIMLLFLVRYDRTTKPGYLCASTFFWGLGVSNHVLMGLFIAAFLAVAVVLIVRPRRHAGLHVAAAILAFLAGAGLYLVLFVRAILQGMPPSSGGLRPWLQDAWQSFRATFIGATGGAFRQRMFSRNPAGGLRFWRLNYLFFLVYNYPTPALAMALYGFWAFWKKTAFRLSFFFVVTGLVVQAAWSANYFVWDMYAFAQPVYVLLSIPIGLSAAELLKASRALRTAFLVLLLPMLVAPGILYARMGSWYRSVDAVHRFFDRYPDLPLTTHTWRPVEYVCNPNKRSFDEVERYAEALFKELPRGAHFLSSDARADYPLRYYYRDRLGRRRDIVYHSIYSPSLTGAEAAEIAMDLKRALARGEPVYTSSILLPEKPVLDRLFQLYDPAWSLDEIGALSEEDYLARYPHLELQKIVFSARDEIWIYRLSPRPAGATRP